jgi:hypothetical protein
MVQYIFDGPEIEVMIKPHGNSKSDRPFFRTSSTTGKHIQELSKQTKPKEVVEILTKEQGGVTNLQSYGMVPRDRKQVVNARFKGKERRDKDPLYSVMLECKLAMAHLLSSWMSNVLLSLCAYCHFLGS